MNIDEASPGLSEIMNQTGADAWSHSADGYILRFKKWKRKGYERRLVPVEQVEAFDRSIEEGIWPPRVKREEFVRLEDSDT